MKRTNTFYILFTAYLLILPSTLHAQTLQISSSSFVSEDYIPPQFTCQGMNVNPPLFFSGIPANTQSLAIIMDDPDAPMGTWVHWVVFNLPPTTQLTSKNTLGTFGKNDWGKLAYGGPCPPDGTHRYFFKLYALDSKLNLNPGITKSQLEKAMAGHIIEQAVMVGLYQQR
jgi:Raf kinase inhibitor-like YbhB/YbcL family protein